jgi:hypothetical protein
VRYRRLDSAGDYATGQGRQNFLTGAEAVAQAVYTRLKLLQTEWWEDQADGLPLFQQLLGHFGPGGNKDAADLIIRTRILETVGVTAITTFSSTYDAATRNYTFNCEIDTEYGNTTLTTTNLEVG